MTIAIQFRLRFVNLEIAWIIEMIWPVRSNIPIASFGGAGAEPVLLQSLDPATAAWISAVIANGGTVSNAEQGYVDTLITGLKADGIWTKLDRLWLFASENTPQALTDIVADSLATAVNSPTFTTNRGYTGNGSTSYVDSNFNPTTASSPKYVQNSAMIGGWSNTGGNLTEGFLGLTTRNSYIDVMGFNPNITEAGINSTSAGPGFANSFSDVVGLGWYTTNRDSSSSTQMYLNGTNKQSNAGDTSAAPTNSTFTFERGSFSTFTTRQISAAAIGGSLSAADHSNLYTRLRTYMTSVGVP